MNALGIIILPKLLVTLTSFYAGKYHRAEELFKESMILLPDQASTYNNLGKPMI